MIKKTLTSIAFAAGCAIALAAPAQAQVIATQAPLWTMEPRPNAGHGVEWMASGDRMQDGRYEHRLRTDPAFRQSRMQKECGPITDMVLRVRCEDSFSAWQDEPSLGWQERTGGSTGTMNSTGALPDTPNTVDPGAGR